MDRESSQKGGTIILDIVGADARLDEEHGYTVRGAGCHPRHPVGTAAATTVHGRGVVVAERAFNRLAGFGPGDDRLPAFFRKETLSPGGNVWDVPDEDLDKMFS